MTTHVSNAASGSNPQPAHHASRPGRFRAAALLILFGFVIGFGVVHYLADHEKKEPLVAKAVSLPLPHAQPNAAPEHSSAANQPPSTDVNPSEVDSSDLDSEASDSVATSDSPGPPDTLSNRGEHEAAVALAKFLPNTLKNVGETALDFSLPDSAGNQVSLSTYRGKIVFLNFWATWCPACRDEMASMQSLYGEFKNRSDVEFLAVSIDEEGWSKISPYLKEIGFDLPVLSDTESRVSAAYHIPGIPTTFIIGRDGQVVWNCAGGINWTDANLKSALSKLFAPS
jgi:peroxiredoxin